MKAPKHLLELLTVTFALLTGGVAHSQPQFGSFIWTKLPIHTSLPSGWRSCPSSIDVSRGIIYSLSDSGVFWKYDIRSNAFTQLAVSGWPGRADTFVYNPDENSIWLTLHGRGQVFRLPVAGGAVTSVGASGASFEDFGDVGFWNPVTHKFGTAFGYGFFAVRNWRWEFGSTNTDWFQIEANIPGREPWTRVVNSAAVDFGGKRLFVSGFLGNSSGSQGQFDPGFSNNGDQFDYVKDLWSLNLQSNQWSKLIPLNTSIPVEGRIVYFPPLDSLLMVNGYRIPTNANISVPVTNLWVFRIGQNTNWTQASFHGDAPNGSDELPFLYGPSVSSFYDQSNERILHFNNRGVYALSISNVNSGLLQGLVAYYPFNGNADDVTGRNHDGTVHGASLVADRHGASESAFCFDGLSYISVTNSGELAPTNDFSVSFWVKANRAITPDMIVLSKSLAYASESGWHVAFHPAGSTTLEWLQFQAAPYFEPNASTILPPASGVWFHAVFTFTKSNGLCEAFLNGQLTDSRTRNYSDANVARNLTIGAQEVPWGSGYDYFLTGCLDDIRIYNRALSSAEVGELYALETPMLPSDMTPPEITCPGDVMVGNDASQCGAVVTYAAPVGTDDRPGATTIQTAGLPSGSSFPVGCTTNTFTVTDLASNSASCSFVVTVVDTEPPSIFCPTNMFVEFTGKTGAVGIYTGGAIDRCSGPVPVNFWPPSGSLFPIGVSSVRAAANDAAGNSNSCSFLLTVVGPHGTKSNLVSELLVQLSTLTDPYSRSNLQHGLIQLQSSVKAHKWIDQTHVTRAEGEDVFQGEEDMAEKLQLIINHRTSGVPDPVWEGYLKRLIAVDRVVAEVQIDDARAAGVSLKKIASALKLLKKGDDELSKRRPDRAIEYYFEAWDSASFAQIVNTEHLPNGHVRLTIVGDPNTKYTIQGSTNGGTSWTTLAKTKSDSRGMIVYTDTSSSAPTRVYRIQAP